MKQHEGYRLRRLRPLRWRDLRLWSGFALLIVAMLIGAQLLNSEDERIMVWRATSDMAVGSLPHHIEPVWVALGGAESAYVSADVQPDGRLQIPVLAGQLLPAGALGGTDLESHQVTVAVEAGHAPIDLAAGHLVDVWATSQEAISSRILASARVISVADDGGRGGHHVVLSVPEDSLAKIITALRTQVIDLVAVPVTGNRT
jgi:hypothetical protein